MALDIIDNTEIAIPGLTWNGEQVYQKKTVLLGVNPGEKRSTGVPPASVPTAIIRISGPVTARGFQLFYSPASGSDAAITFQTGDPNASIDFDYQINSKINQVQF